MDLSLVPLLDSIEGQVETVCEKRRREVEYSKAGLELPDSDRLKIKKSDGASHNVEVYEENIQSKAINDSDYLHSSLPERIVLHDTPVSIGSSQKGVCANETDSSDGDGDLSFKEVTDEIIQSSMAELPQKSTRSSSYDDEVVKSKVDGDPKDNLDGENNQESYSPARNLITPTVVHVSRPKEVEKQRAELPIIMMEQEIMEAINDNIAVIIGGASGCGKTTQIPQFLYEAGFGSNQVISRSGIIGVTQPRRVAVLATAKRVAFELGLGLGKEVDFQVRHNRKVAKNCSIKFMTDGILLREVQTDFLLKRYSVLILDEVHERSLNIDILIGMLSRVIQQRQREFEEQQKWILSRGTIECCNRIYPLKLVLMRATLCKEDFVSDRRFFRNPPPVIEVPTKQYEVTTHFSNKTELIDYIGQAFKKVMSMHERLPPGGILVFVTGQGEVEYLCQRLRRASQEIVANEALRNNESTSTSISIGPMRVLPLYSMLPASSQLRVFEEVKEGKRLVVVATNIAEASLTIPAVKYVVDTGREKVKNYNSSNGMETYDIQWISQASALQRAGRAGRTGPGHCYRLYSSAVYNNLFPKFSSPEISKVPLDGVVLLMRSMNIFKVENFPFPTPPEKNALVEAERRLKVLKALDDKGRLTPLGKDMARYPMRPRHSRIH